MALLKLGSLNWPDMHRCGKQHIPSAVFAWIHMETRP